MLFTSDIAAGFVLLMGQSGSFAGSDHTISFRCGFLVFYAHLLVFQTVGFAVGQGAGSLALLNASFLIFLALVDARGFDAGEAGLRQAKKCQQRAR